MTTSLTFRPGLLSVVVLGIVLGACRNDTIDPDTLPYRFEEIAQWNRGGFAVDLDLDGVDELVTPMPPGSIRLAPSNSPILIYDLEPETLTPISDTQINVRGRVVSVVGVDSGGGRGLSAVAAVVRGDSLFAALISMEVASDGTRRPAVEMVIFVTIGRARVDGDTEYPWDPTIPFAAVRDVDSNGADELVLLLSAGYAGLPRGVSVHDLASGRLIGQKIVGAKVAGPVVGDFDGNGFVEVITGGYAPDNQTSAGGFSDKHAHIIAFELYPEPKVVWSDSILSPSGRTKVHYGHFVTSRKRHIAKMMYSWLADAPIFILEIIDPITREIVKRREFSAVFSGLAPVDVDRDGLTEFIVFDNASHEVVLLNSDLTEIRRRRLAVQAASVNSLEDLDGDGLPEVVLKTQPGENLVFLGDDLAPKAALQPTADAPGGDLHSAFHRGPRMSPALQYWQAGRTRFFEMKPNTWYRWHRAASLLGPHLVTIILCLSVIAGIAFVRRSHLYAEYGQAVTDMDQRALALVSPGGRVLRANARTRHLLSRDTEDAGVGPELKAFITSSARNFAVRQSTRLPSPGDASKTLSATMNPLHVHRFGKPYWLLTVDEPGHPNSARPVGQWSLMAQRVAHDLKNPLTSILLSARHLQSEIEKVHPDASAMVDRQVTRIADRIEYLRRNTNSFLKVIDLSKPELVASDINAFVDDGLAPVSQSLPPDIQLQKKLRANLPAVHLDHDQMRSVVESLVSNAVNAMPSGGRIVVATSLAAGILPPGESGRDAPVSARDYVVVEFQDTGTGMSRDVLDHIFEPGFTTSETGSGLGMAIVRKVMDDHEGYVVIESEPGSGTAVCLYLPVRGPSIENV